MSMRRTMFIVHYLRVIAHRERFRPYIVAVIVFAVYLITGPRSNPYNHYVLLADSFLHGRLDLVNPPSFLEVARVHGRAYVINPPAPTIFLLPFVAIWGTRTNQVPVSAAVGAAAAGFFWVAARRLWSDLPFRTLMFVLFAFGTNLWWAASDGGMWTFAHASAVLFCTAALVEALGRRRAWLVGLLVGLGGLSRLPVFLTFPVFVFLMLETKERSSFSRKTYKQLALFALPLLMCAVSDLVYNFVRYGTFTDSGYASRMYLAYSWFRNYGVSSPAHIPRHLYAIFLAPPLFREGFPFLHPSFLGMGLFFTTPAFLFIFRAPLRRRTVAALVSLAAGSAAILTYWATGWSQFGYRFSLDVYVPLLILTAAGMRERVNRHKLALIALCCAINLWGVLSWNIFHTALT